LCFIVEVLKKGDAMENDTQPTEYSRAVKAAITEWGADLVGVADIEPLKGLKLTPPNLLDPYTRAVSIGVRIPRAVFEQIQDRPTPVYSAVYQTANRLLDEIGIRTASLLEKGGFASLPIPASQVLDRENWYGAISHKAVGRMAGLGWQGKSLLLVNPRYGPRIRLVSVLTKAPLIVDGPIKNRCGSCTMCRDACPIGAIRGVSTEDHYHSRREAVHIMRCGEKLRNDFAQLPQVNGAICGICIKVCPFGRYSRPRFS
jgi:epoxyqueuosine reductase QueG